MPTVQRKCSLRWTTLFIPIPEAAEASRTSTQMGNGSWHSCRKPPRRKCLAITLDPGPKLDRGTQAPRAHAVAHPARISYPSLPLPPETPSNGLRASYRLFQTRLEVSRVGKATAEELFDSTPYGGVTAPRFGSVRHPRMAFGLLVEDRAIQE